MHTYISRVSGLLTGMSLRSRKTQISIGAIVVALLAIIAYFSTLTAEEAVTIEQVRTVQTIPVAQFAQTSSSATASAASHETVLRAETTGKVVRVANVGSRVTAGQVVAQLDNQSQSAALLQAEGVLDSAKLSQQKVSDGTRVEELAVTESDIAKNEAALEQANEALMNAILDAYADIDTAIRIDVYQFVSNARTTPTITVTTTNNQAVIDLAANIVDIEGKLNQWQQANLSMNASNAASSVELAQKVTTLASTLLSNASKILNAAVPSTAASQSTIDGYTADIAAARATVNTAAAAVTTAVTAQRNAIATLDASKKTLALKKAGAVQTDIESAAAGVKQAEGAYGSALAAYEKTLIRARIAGTVIACSVQVGDIVGVGNDICRTVSSGSDLGSSFALPLSAVKYTPAGAYVFTVGSDNTLKAMQVETGLVTASSITVIGLAGSEVIVKDVRGFKEGDTVSVQ